jgi:nitrogen fixation protein FixH
MNMFVSIFGGMLLTVVVFGMVRSLRMSNFWAAVIAAAVPSFSYMAYAVVSWPGLDVLTMHIVAFPTVALLLFQIGGSKDAPYQKMHWAPKLLIGFFLVITLILGGFVYIAGKGVPPDVAQWLLPDSQGKRIHTGFAGVVAHGEEASKTIAHYRSMDNKLNRLGWSIEVNGLAALREGKPSEVSVMLNDKDGRSVPDVSVRLGLGRPGQLEQSVIELFPFGDGSYRAKTMLPAAGEWLAVVTLEKGGERIQFERTLAGE